LVQQLANDFKRLLPDEIVGDCSIDTPETKDLSKWMLATHQRVLTHYWPLLDNAKADGNERFLCFDEQHDAAKEELYKKRMAILAKRYPVMFLSATPTKDAYAICGGRSVATLSRQEKEAMGIAKAAVSHELHAEKLVSQKSKKHAKINVFQRMILAFVNALEYERISPAHEYVDKCELAIAFRNKDDAYYREPTAGASEEDIRAFIRWNIHCPIGDKALVLMSQHDTVINYGLLSNGERYDPYRQGNRVPRENVYRFFQLPNVDDDLLKDKYEQAKLAMRQQNILTHLQANFPDKNEDQLKEIINKQVDFSREDEYLKHRVLHGLIENTLMYLTGYDSQRLDQERFHNPEPLMALVLRKISDLGDEETPWAISTNEIEAWLIKEGIPSGVRAELIPCMREIIIQMRLNKNIRKEANRRLIDNWSLDHQLHLDYICSHYAQSYFQRYKTVFLVNGLEQSPSAIPSNRPFYKLYETEESLDSDEVRANPKLRHQYSTLEALDDTTSQRTYLPQHFPQHVQDEYSAQTIDNLFRHGLIGSYVTSERVTGFNDPDLHHVALVMDSYEDRLNEPAQIIQGSGRNRGLNPIKQPFFFLATDNSAVSLSPSVLDKKDYYSDFFSATDAYRKKMAGNIGKNIMMSIKFWIENNASATGELDTSALNAEIQRLVLDELERVYNNNDHDFERTKIIFSTVLEDVYKSLYVQCEMFKSSYSMPMAAKIIGHILNFIMSLYYQLVTAKSYYQFVKAAKRIEPRDDETQNAALYGHIVKNYDYKQLIKAGIPAKRFKILVDQVKKKAIDTLKTKVLQQPMDYLKPDYIQSVDALVKEKLAPSLLRFMGTTEQQIQLQTLINQQAHWIEQVIPLYEQLKDGNPDTVATTFFEMIKTNPEIDTYLKNEEITLDMKRMESVKKDLEQTGVQIFFSPGANTLSQDLINQFTAHFQKLLYPNDAEFFAKHAHEITPKSIKTFLQNGLPTMNSDLNAMVKLVKQLLPPKTVKAANDGNFLHEESYLNHAIALPETDLAKIVNPDAVRHYLADSFSTYFKSPFLRKFMETTLKPLSDDQLTRVLDAVYPEEKVKANAGDFTINGEKMALLRSFTHDLKQLSVQDLFKKYAVFDQADEASLNRTSLVQMFNWINKIFTEILHCQCYYHEMGEKGEVLYNEENIRPKLKGESDHEIWEMKSNANGSSPTGRVVGAIAKKTKFITAARQSLDQLSQVEELSTRHTATWLKEVAEHSVREMMPFFKNKDPKKSKNKKTTAQTELSDKATTIGEAVKKSASMSDKTVKDPQTKYRSAVDELRESLMPKNDSTFPKQN